MSTNTHSPSSEVSLTYKFLLTFSTLCAVFFCWLYVTKPTQVINATPAGDSKLVAEPEPPTSGEADSSSFESLTSNALPGDSPERPKATDAHSSSSTIPLAKTASTDGQLGWEETNHRVQHVLTAQNGTSSERIILQVPVIYQTRGIRLGTEQAKEAARVLRALTIYQEQITKLHQDGKNIQHAWDMLLLSAQPISALRADSPSLPSAQHPETLSENSAATINISQ